MSKLMNRLSDGAFAILSAEVQQCGGNNHADRVRREIVIQRLQKLRTQSGDRLTEAELRHHICDIFPDFSQKVIEQGAKNNRSPGLWTGFKWAALLGVGGTGMLMFLNLPYPMIRRPVAKTAPILLLPSFMTMDHHYREAIALVQQADQLVNQATSQADLTLGKEKVTQAQQHLDALPVWFLDYEPRAYCSLVGCSWRFTFDEFKAAREQIARMEAKLFQEQNAQTQLDEGVAALNAAKQEYDRASTQLERSTAMAAWQTALDGLSQVPPQTLAHGMAQTQLAAAQRDFQQVTGTVASSQRTSKALEAAKIFAIQAAKTAQNPPHTAAEWTQIANLWQEAIQRLKQVQEDDSGYLEAQSKLAEYQTNLGTVQVRQQAEQTSLSALDRAKDRISDWQDLAASKPTSPRLVSILQDIINELDKVQTGTTVSEEAQQLEQFARNKLEAIQP